MARDCGMCRHPNRADLETRILRREPIVLIAADAGLSVSAVNRHRRAHLTEELRAALSIRTASHVSNYADQLAELAGDANSVRQFAVTSNNPDLLLRAGAAKRDLLLVLTRQLGVDSDETVEGLREAMTSMNAIVQVLPRHPDALIDFLAYLDTHGNTDIADALRGAWAKGGVLPALSTAKANRPTKELS
ncbi:MAG: hypothetical protein QM572_05790 [Nocardioides sp.]|uniref:hypothetical protein n=1 Tax=Nocardioides sp. TaxID=35761 RepID=UPI0039E2839C